MKAILKKVKEDAQVIDTRITYKFMRQIVGGFIQMVPIGPCVDVVCNENGMFAGPNQTPLPQNVAGYLGDILLVASDDECECRGMTEEEIRKGLAYLERFKDEVHSGPEIGFITGSEATLFLEAIRNHRREIWDSL